MKVVMRAVRWFLGRLILLLDWVFTPKGIQRDPAEQANIDQQTGKMSLYQYAACPFCVKVRRNMKRNTLSIQTHDAKRSEISRKELIQGGGKLKVPCLKIEDDAGAVSWIYESSEIISYLEQRFTAQRA